MGNIISDSNFYCCCNKYLKSIHFSVKNKTKKKCDIILNRQYEINGFTQNNEISIFSNIEQKSWFDNFISLINQLIHNNKQLSKDFFDKIKNIFEKVLNECLIYEDVLLYLNNFNYHKGKYLIFLFK